MASTVEERIAVPVEVALADGRSRTDSVRVVGAVRTEQSHLNERMVGASSLVAVGAYQAVGKKRRAAADRPVAVPVAASSQAVHPAAAANDTAAVRSFQAWPVMVRHEQILVLAAFVAVAAAARGRAFDHVAADRVAFLTRSPVEAGGQKVENGKAISAL